MINTEQALQSSERERIARANVEDALALYRRHGKKAEGLPKSPMTKAARNALKADIQNLAEVANRRYSDVTPSEVKDEQKLAMEHFELACWLSWFMETPGGRDDVAVGALIIFLLFENGFNKPTYEFHTLTGFGERSFDNILERDEGDDVIDELNKLVKAFGTERSRASLVSYGWSR
ncbi:MAG: hypothetical protein DDT34_02186 [Firmicutes bacterium]|nr:hypothetical protein [Bacillota bacterium]